MQLDWKEFMRQPLRTVRDKFSILDSIRELRGKVEYLLWATTSGQPQWFEAPTFASLPPASSVSRYSTGIVIGVGSDNGAICWVSPDGQSWHMVNMCQ